MSIAEALRTRWRLVVAVLVVVLVLALGTWWINRPQQTQVAPTTSPTPTVSVPAPPSSTASPVAVSPSSAAASTAPVTTASTSPAAALADCQPIDGKGFVPDRFTMEHPPADERVLALGLDADGAIAAPPKNQPRTASWWNGGPRPGSDKGKVVMSIHTYRTGDALGNEMYAGGTSQLKAGDLIKLHGPGGKVACYEFVEAKKVWVTDYDPNSDVMVDFDGTPMLAIVICWDFKKSDEIWHSRIFFYAKPVSVPA